MRGTTHAPVYRSEDALSIGVSLAAQWSDRQNDFFAELRYIRRQGNFSETRTRVKSGFGAPDRLQVNPGSGGGVSASFQLPWDDPVTEHNTNTRRTHSHFTLFIRGRFRVPNYRLIWSMNVAARYKHVTRRSSGSFSLGWSIAGLGVSLSHNNNIRYEIYAHHMSVNYNPNATTF